MAGNSQQQERMARLPEAAELITQPHLRNELRDIADRPWRPISPFPESGHLTATRAACRLRTSVGPDRHKLNVFPHKQISRLGPAPTLTGVHQAHTHTKRH